MRVYFSYFPLSWSFQGTNFGGLLFGGSVWASVDADSIGVN